MSTPDIVGLRSRLARPAPLFGIFTRLTDPAAYETIALTDVNVLMIGAEHGSFGRAALAQGIFALRCPSKYVLVRLRQIGTGAHDSGAAPLGPLAD